MTITLQRPQAPSVTDADSIAGDREQLHRRRELANMESSSITADRAEERHQRAKQLAALADGDRHALEDLRARYLHRLHRTSDDFDATDGLRTVELALSMTPRTAEPWTWQRRERRRRRRWWHRRRSG